VIDGKHELYTLSIAMMLGLRYSIFLTNNQILEDRKNGRMWLDSDEFMKVEKYIFRPDGGQNTPPHQLSHTFKFKDYSPIPFAFIRRMFGINEYEFHHSVCGNANFIEFISNAKSGQFFFYSSDGKFMIKTMTNVESKFLRRSKSWISSNLIECHSNYLICAHTFLPTKHQFYRTTLGIARRTQIQF
jgi:1-phosphatidylinositol-4-phosphate 5-kinase